MRELKQDPQQAFPGKGVMQPEQAEMERLRKEVTKLKMELDILKKAATYFARESMRDLTSWRSTEWLGRWD